MYTAHRAGRPWVGDKVTAPPSVVPSYDPSCALCPGNKRIHGTTPKYTGVYCFTNDLPPFSDEAPFTPSTDELYRNRPAHGTAEVLCYHPDHSKTFADLSPIEAANVVRAWTDRYTQLAGRPNVNHVLIFENKGSLVGTSNPHPHCQIYASNLIYGITEREHTASVAHFKDTGQSLLMEIVVREAIGPRVVCQNNQFLACVPWFARYAYEVFILPKRLANSLADLTDEEQVALAALMREVSIRYDNLWKMPFPYVMAIHQAPTDGKDYSQYPFHIEYHPPLRKPDTMKYLAGPEIGGGSMTNESDPDTRAAELRNVAKTLYRENV